MKLADANQGDTFKIDGQLYMAMIRLRGSWGCRPLLDDQTYGEHVFFDDTEEVGTFVTRQEKYPKLDGRNEETHQLGGSRKEWWSL